MAKQSLKPCPLTLAGVTILSRATAWGLPPLYRLADIYAATPGAVYTLADLRTAMTPPVSASPEYWTGDHVSTGFAWSILAIRQRELGKLPTNSFPAVPASLGVDADANRKAINAFVRTLVTANNWMGIRAGLAGSFEYSGPVAVPVWEAPLTYAPTR